MFRIDPINDAGKIDVDFFSSEDYAIYRECLERYLVAEGFDVIEQKTIIRIMGRTWMVFPPKQQAN